MKQAAKELSMLDLLEVLFFHKKLIAIVLLLSIVAASYYSFTTEEIYESELLLRLVQREDKVILSEQNRSTEILRPTRFEFVLDEIQLLTSEATIQRALGTMGSTRSSGAVSRQLLATPLNKTTVIRLSFSDSDPRFASDFLQHLVTAYQEMNSDIKQKGDIVDYYEVEARIYQSRVDSLQQLVSAIRQQGKLYDFDRQQLQLIDAVKNIDDRHLEMRVSHQAIENELAVLDNSIDDPYLFSFSSSAFAQGAGAALQSLKTQFLDADRQLQEAKRIYVDNHPIVLQAEESRARQLELFSAELKGLRRLLLIRKEELAAQIQENRQRLAATQIRLEDLSLTRDELVVLEQQREAEQDVLDNLLAKQKELRIDSFVDARNMKVVVLAPAVPAEDPASPNRFRIILMASFLGLLLGSLIAFFLRATNPVFTSPSDVERVLGVPVIATIPVTKSRF
jgi:uncharacterized protein involved in exopolysaccharide biosynthesis